MANIFDPMDLKQIITLHLVGLSNRKVATLLGISRNTVNSYLRLFKASGLPLPTLLELDEHAISDLFSSFTTVDTNRHNDLMLYLYKMNNEFNHPCFTYQYHYQQYVEQIKDPYSYSQFLEHYHRKYPAQKGSMKIDHIAGEEMFIGFADKKLQIIDRATGEFMNVEVFVTILPCSH